LGVEIERFAAATAADPRRLRSMALEQAELAAEVRAIADRQEVPRRVLDPVHDASFAKLWLAALPDRQLRLLQRCLTDEVRRRGNAVVLSAAE
jgi:hypothetical protein